METKIKKIRMKGDHYHYQTHLNKILKQTEALEVDE